VADEEQKISEFLIELSEDPARLEAYFENPADVVLDSKLSKDNQKLILSGDVDRISAALQEELPEADFAHGRVRTIIPWPVWPILRPVRRVDY
jgi:hypothetical protein